VTNSPPDNVKKFALNEEEEGRVVAAGIDSLRLAINLRWSTAHAFKKLAECKDLAKAASDDEPIAIKVEADGSTFRFVVTPHGKNGYEWLLVGQQFSIQLGHWAEPIQRPSAMVDIRSEALWTYGPDAAVKRAALALESMGAKIVNIKPSRIDLCVDVLIREESWHGNLDEHFVCRAHNVSRYRSRRKLSGFTVGKGAMSARLYDKPLEIRDKSHKTWMYDVWGLSRVPEDHRIVRVEFQIRRDMLREVGLNSWDETMRALPSSWSYSTKRWLRLVKDAGLHKTQQTLEPWWSVVQDGFPGAQGATPVVREKALNMDKKRLASQSIGTLTSIFAASLDDDDYFDAVIDPASVIRAGLGEALRCVDIDPEKFTKCAERKRAAIARARALDSAETTDEERA
jgi:hypothetical protein